MGVSGKWGLSTTITLEATLNPDFSQVESDAVQVEVNQRYPVFFSEKRPFFMEGAAAFNLAGNAQGDASMLYAVHTRKSSTRSLARSSPGRPGASPLPV